MILSIFSFFFDLLGCGWRLLTWVAGVSLRFFSAVFTFALDLAGAVLGLLFTPFTWALDRLWDFSLDLRGIFTLGMGALLIACALLAVLAVGNNVYRKFHNPQR